MKPACNFFIAGGQRCGTSWLYTQLDKHPDICMAKPAWPEPKYFLKPPPKSESEYRRLYFSHYSGEKCAGEKTTSYCDSEKAPEYIYSLFPDAKIVFVLRNPIERALSNYFFSIKNGLENRSPREVFIEKTPPPLASKTSTDPFNYVGRSNYALYLKRYLDIFGDKQVCSIVFEAMVIRFDELRKVYEHLELDTEHLNPCSLEQINHASRDIEVPREVIEQLATQTKPYVAELQSLLPQLDLSAWSS